MYERIALGLKLLVELLGSVCPAVVAVAVAVAGQLVAHW